MKNISLLFVTLFLCQVSFANHNALVVVDPILPTLSDISICDSNQDGIATFDLTVQNASILAAQSGNVSDYSITYYETFTDANVGGVSISSPSLYNNINPNSQIIYVRISNVNTNAFAVGSFHIIVNTPTALVTPTPLKVCDDDANPNNQYHSFDLTIKNTEITQNVGSTVTYYPSYIDALNNTNVIVTPTNYTNVQPAIQTVGVRVNAPTGCVSFTILDIRVYPIPTPNTDPPTLVACDGNNDGLEVFDLTVNAAYICNGDSNLVTHYYQTITDAIYQTNEILTPTAALVGYNVWIRVENIFADYQGNHCYTLVEQPITVTNNLQVVVYTLNNTNAICVDYLTNTVLRSLTLRTNIINPSAYSFVWYENGNFIGANPTYTVNTPALNGVTRDYSVVVTSNSSSNCNSTSLPYAVIQSGPAVIPQNTSGYEIINLSGIQSIVVSMWGYGTYQYSLDNGPRQVSNVFDNVSLGIHTVTVYDTEGGLNYSCDPYIIENIIIVTSQVSAPTGLNSQSFTAGATLANIAVSGTNIQWYASANSSTPIPLNTLLVNGTTYYATQTVGGIQSAARLAVTVQLNLGLPNNEKLVLQYAPNPLKDSLTLESSVVLKSIVIYTILGQKVFEQSCNNTHIILDLKSLNSGNYFLKAEGEIGQKTLRIIKE